MSIKAPGSRFGSSVHMRGLHIGGHGRRKALGFYLNLTPMIDMFTILVVFLLITFSASGEILMSSADIELPSTYSNHTLERVPTVAITADAIIFDGEPVVKTGFVTDENIPDGKIEDLGLRLAGKVEIVDPQADKDLFAPLIETDDPDAVGRHQCPEISPQPGG